MRWILWLTLLTVQAASEEEACNLFDEMNLNDLISVAKTHSPILEEADSRIALAQVELAKTHWLSRVLPSASFSWGTNLGVVSVEEGRLWEEQGSRMRWSLNLSWSLGKLYWGRFEHRKAKLDLRQALLDRENAERFLVRRVTQSWLLLEKLREKEKVLREELSTEEESVKHTVQRYKRQRITFEEVSKSQLELHRVRLNVIECLQEQLIARQELMDLIGW